MCVCTVYVRVCVCVFDQFGCLLTVSCVLSILPPTLQLIPMTRSTESMSLSATGYQHPGLVPAPDRDPLGIHDRRLASER